MVIKCTHRADGVADDYTTAMAVTDTAIHEIDVLPWLVNDEWDEVQCIMPKTNSKVKNALKDPQIMIMKTRRHHQHARGQRKLRLRLRHQLRM